MIDGVLSKKPNKKIEKSIPSSKSIFQEIPFLLISLIVDPDILLVIQTIGLLIIVASNILVFVEKFIPDFLLINCSRNQWGKELEKGQIKRANGNIQLLIQLALIC